MKEMMFVAFIDAEIQTMGQRRQYGTAKRFLGARNSFVRYLSGRRKTDLPLQEITATLVCGYQEWLWSIGICRNTSSCYLRTLCTAYNRAVASELVTDVRPFASVYRGVGKTRKRAISVESLRRFQRLDIRYQLVKAGHNPCRKTFPRVREGLELARDLFFFSFCARGMAFVDMVFLRQEDVRNGVLRYARHKTGQRLEVKVEPMMQDIIQRYTWGRSQDIYIFPILTSIDEMEAYAQYTTARRIYNRRLGILSDMLGIHLSSYVSRHSWATNAYQQQIPLSVISHGLGHHSERTTQIYLKSLDNSLVDQANHDFLCQVLVANEWD